MFYSSVSSFEAGVGNRQGAPHQEKGARVIGSGVQLVKGLNDPQIVRAF